MRKKILTIREFNFLRKILNIFLTKVFELFKKQKYIYLTEYLEKQLALCSVTDFIDQVQIP